MPLSHLGTACACASFDANASEAHPVREESLTQPLLASLYIDSAILHFN